MAAAVCTVNDVLDGHVTLDVECLDRVYLNAYVPNLQVAGQVVVFLTQHLGNPIPSPAVFTKIGNAFRAAVERFAAEREIPVVRFASSSTAGWPASPPRSPWPTRPPATGGSCRCARSRSAAPWSLISPVGPGFIKLCSYFPYPAKVWVNGHEWAKRQAHAAGITFTELANGFAACHDLLRPLAGPHPHPAHPGRPGRRLLVGAVDAPDRGQPHPGL